MKRYFKLFVATAASVAAGAAYYMQSNPVVDDILPEKEEFDRHEIEGKFVNKAYENAIRRSKTALLCEINAKGLPGVVIGVSVDGQVVWTEGIGLANVETQTPCTSKTKMRIASLSKPITMGLMAKLIEDGKVDLTKPIQEYVPYFPVKKSNGKEVVITPKHLACHKSGVRHYKEMDKDTALGDGGPEFYLKDAFTSVEQSVNLFKEDELLFSPGEKFEYTTHGYTLLSAVIEGAAKKPFAKVLRQYLDTLGLTNTHLDEVSTLVYERANYYVRNKAGCLKNARLTDNSYKWAGGGLVADVEDILKFANIMLYSYQQDGSQAPGYLSKETTQLLWTPVEGTDYPWGENAGYGLGWTVVPRLKDWSTPKDRQRFHVGHSGGAVGASSVLVIFPLPSTSNTAPSNVNNNTPSNVNNNTSFTVNNNNPSTVNKIPSGVCVTIITNLQSVGLYRVAKQTAENFISVVESNLENKTDIK